MKKIINALLLIIFPLIVLAKDYSIEAVYINATTDIIGSVHVQEAVVIDGNIEEFTRSLNYINPDYKGEWNTDSIDFKGSSFYNARAASLAHAAAFEINKNEMDWKLLSVSISDYIKEKDDSADIDKYYVKEKTELGEKVTIHYKKSEKDLTVYYFDYYIDQLVVLHEDVGEIYWQVIPKGYGTVKKLFMQFLLPGASYEENFRCWAHGNVDGIVSPISPGKDDDGKDYFTGAAMELSKIKDNSSVDLRILFNKERFSSISKILNNSNQEAFDKIVEIEAERTNSSTKNQRFHSGLYTGVVIISIFYILATIALGIYITKTTQKTHKKKKINSDAAIDLDTSEYLLNKTISSTTFLSKMINLVYKNKIDVYTSDNDVILELKGDKLSKEDKQIVNILFEHNKKINLDELKNIVSDKEVKEKYQTWVSTQVINAKNEGYFSNNLTTKLIGIIMFVLGIILVIFNYVFKVENIFITFSLMITSIVLLTYTLLIDNKTSKGKRNIESLEKVKKELKEFSLLEKDKLPDYSKWSKHLSYSILFNMGEQFEKDIHNIIEKYDLNSEKKILEIFKYSNIELVKKLKNVISKLDE